MQAIAPREILMDGKIFDPHAHFGAWRKKQWAWEGAKLERIKLALNRARELREQGHSYPKIANALNEDKLPSPTGRPWTTDNIRKLMGKPL